MQDGTFDEALIGIDGVVHAASPCTTLIDDPAGRPFPLSQSQTIDISFRCSHSGG